jgi:hypothetical protein
LEKDLHSISMITEINYIIKKERKNEI